MQMKYAVLGAGHGGLAMAGHLGLMGHQVRLWARNQQALDGVARSGGVMLSGVVEGFGPVDVRPDLAGALAGADLVLVVVPASAHREIAYNCAPYLSSGQKVLLMPGRTAGAIEFRHTLRAAGCTADVLVGEAQTFLYASRRTGPASARIHGIKRTVCAAALPARRTMELLDAIKPAFPQFMPARWVWKTSLDNIGAIFHPAVVLMNTGWIETTRGTFRHYLDGISPAVAGCLERLDAERVAVARALGVGALSAIEWLGEAYGSAGSTLYEAIQQTPAYFGVGAIDTIDHRYLWEDVPTGLVPIAELGRACSVPTPLTDSLIALASAVCGQNFRSSGRTLARLGLEGLSPEQIAYVAMEGEMIGA
ncbi:MAG TPA: NAD/NADP octopine/nopaline dehydrogenase family protein [Symbiobacteriaceae bacterium]|jgi:opine dehydrogenase|nr:NAD/NADP octopine/nopaline dehydrogenase family protein [Symbiobacteriaceae bacterium]